MKDEKKIDWAQQARLDIDKYSRSSTFIGDMPVTPEAFTRAYAEGFRSNEKRESLYIQRSDFGAAIPVSFHIPHAFQSVINKDLFSFTTNQDFGDVMGACAVPRSQNAGDDGKWIRDRTKKILYQLRAQDIAHSIEIYDREGVPSGGALLFQVGGTKGKGGVVVSMSVYNRDPAGAGKAAFVALQAILCRHEFGMHDCIMPSTIAYLFGGSMVTREQAMAIRKPALQMDRDFPTIPDRLSIKQYCAPLLAP